MGITIVKLTIKNPQKIAKKITENFLADTGTHYTVLTQNMVKKLSITAN